MHPDSPTIADLFSAKELWLKKHNRQLANGNF